MRRLLTIFILLFCTCSLSAQVSLTQLTDTLCVYVDRAYAAENGMVFIGPDHVTVVGATWTPETAEALHREIAEVTTKPVREVINTNYHPDRAGGNPYWGKAGCRIHATRRTHDLMRSDWDVIGAWTRASLADYPEVPLALPTDVHDGDFSLEDGRIEVRYLGPSHTEDGVFVYFPDEQVLYGGCILKPFLGNLEQANLDEYPRTLAKLKALDLDIDTVVAGHGRPVHDQGLIDRYLGLLEAHVAEAWACDILVDGDLPEDDPANGRFRTLQAACRAAQAGTADDPTVIGIRPNLYHLAGGRRGAGLRLRKDYLTLLGLTGDRRTVVLADNRGLRQGADDNGYLLDVDATGFTCRNLTIINHCNVDFEYPGDPSKNLARRSDVETQAVALQAAGDRHVYQNVSLISRLDTMFLRTRRSYFKNVHIEGTDDWVGGGGVSLWEDCTLAFPTGQGVCLAMNAVFRRCRFVSDGVMEFYKVGFGSHLRPSTLIDCVVPLNTPDHRIAWMREPAPPRPSVYSLTWRVKDAAGRPTRLYDSRTGAESFLHARELSAEELKAFNPWNLLRAAPGDAPDDWDPAGVRDRYEPTGQGALVYRMELTDGHPEGGRRAADGGAFRVRTGEPGVTIGARLFPARAEDPTVTWSTASDLVKLDRTAGPAVVVTGRNRTEEAAWVPVQASAANGFFVTAWIRVEPSLLDPPAVVDGPVLEPPADGSMRLAYILALDGRADRSLVTWSMCDDRAGANQRVVAVSRGGEPLTSLVLTPGYVGKYIKATLQPGHPRSPPGAPLSVVFAEPVAASDVTAPVVSPDFRHFAVTPNEAFVDGLWTVSENWRIVPAEGLEGGYGIHSTNPARLLYQRDADTGDMRIELVFRPDKKAGQVFSVPGSPADEGPDNLHADIYIKYDPRTGNGYALRFWRTTQDSRKCMFQFYRIENGAGSPLDDRQVLTGAFKRDTRLVLEAVGDTLRATASNTTNGQTLHLESTHLPNPHGGAGISWCRGSSAVFGRFSISYP